VESIIRYVKRSFGYLSEAFGLECLDSVCVRVFGCSPKLNSIGPDRFEEYLIDENFIMQCDMFG
jgi:hypothetical protein